VLVDVSDRPSSRSLAGRIARDESSSIAHIHLRGRKALGNVQPGSKQHSECDLSTANALH
jgi:hypothetical protein